MTETERGKGGDMTVGTTQDELTSDAVRQLRLARGWSQARLARESGLSVRTVGNFERGERQLHPSSMAALMKTLGVPGDPDVTHSRWPDDIRLCLEVLGAFLAALPRQEREDEMLRIFTQIGKRRR